MIDKEEKTEDISEKKRRIRERYKGVDPDSLDIIPAIPQEDFYKAETMKRVAVYARVSTDDPRQTSSYELQKNHYEDVVSRRPNWQLVNIYADEGISGTSLQHRDAFIQMIADCKAGKIDLIVTKSVSRFARNVLDCIGYVRELKALNPPVGVFFETENIYTLNSNSEMSLSFISTLAQEESHTKSEIMNASIEMRFKRGIFLTPPLLGYDQDENGSLVINESEAKIIRLIFFMYLYGYSISTIAESLTSLGLKTKKGNTNWSAASIYQILKNERHCGDVLARKTFTPNYLDHKSKKNNQDRNQYRKRDHHEAIISRDDFIAVQRKLGSFNGETMAYLPKLYVVPEGILRGFVLINPRWTGFKPNDYVDTSAQISVIADDPVTEVSAEKGDFDLRGFEIVRSQLLNVPQKTRMNIANEKIKFSGSCFEKLSYPENIELLFHPNKKIFAVRPAVAGSRDQFQWFTKSKDKYIPKVINGRPFLPTIYELLGWNHAFQYRISGYLLKEGNDAALLFNADDTQIIIPNEEIPPEHKETVSSCTNRKGVPAFPQSWGNSFGDAYYHHENTLPLSGINSEELSISSGAISFEEQKINPTDVETLHNEITKIVKEIKEND